MKTALMPALVAIAWIGLVANLQAVAQNGQVAPAAAAPTMPPSQNAAAAQATPGSQTPGDGLTAAPGAAPDLAADDSLLLDNGLWEGASVGPCCSKCGGGSAAPPDWYTLQGVRVLSRSNTRKLFVSFQTPKFGYYEAVQDVTNPADFHVVNRDVPTDPVFMNPISGQLNSNPFEVLNTKQLGLDQAAGYNVTLGHYFCRDRNNNDHFVEFTFWGLNSWTYTRTIDGYLVPVYDEDTIYDSSQASAINTGVVLGTGVPQPVQASPAKLVGSLRTPFPTARDLPGATDEQKMRSLAFNNGVEQDFFYRSTMNNFELNGRFSPRGEPDRMVLHPDGKWRRECQPGTYMSYLYGLRFMQIDETFRFHSFSQGQYGDDWVLETQHAEGNYGVVTHNSLLGLQIGADMMFRKCRWAWGVQAKVGPYINFATQETSIEAAVIDGTAHPGSFQSLSAYSYPAALIGEVGFQATYKFRPNLMGRAAYDFMWISNLALAPEQLQLVADPVNRINANGTIFSQGVSLGLEWMW